MLIELALLAGAVTAGRSVLKRTRGTRRRPLPVVPQAPDEPADDPLPHRAEVGASLGALVLAGAGHALRSTPLGLASVPLTLWSAQRQFADAHHNLWVERRLGFAVVEGSVTLIGLASGAWMLSAGNALLHTLALSLEAHESARDRAAHRVASPQTPCAWLGPRGPAVPVDDALAGGSITIRGDQRVPVDGRIVEGLVRVHGPVDGRIGPVDLAPGDAIAEGQRVASGAARVRVEATGDRTARRRHADRNRRPSPTLEASARRADRIADASVGFTVPTAAIAGLFGGPSTVLAVLGSNLFSAHRVTGPLALRLHLDALRAAGVEVPDGRGFELVATIDRLCIDLGAVLTAERLTLDGVIAAEGVDGGRCLELAAASLAIRDDPAAQALVEALLLRDRAQPEARGRSADADGGTTAWIDGQRVEVAPAPVLFARGIRRAPELDRRREPAGGWVTLAVAVDGREAALLRFEPTARAGAEALFAGLARMNIVPLLMSADRPAVAERWARRLGVPSAWSALSGSDRTAVIESLQSGGHAVGYLGAGGHDLPGMALADVSLATDPADGDVERAADIVLRGQPLSRVPAVIDFARRYHRGQGRAITLTALTTGTMGFATLAFGLGPLTALTAQALGLGAGIATSAPDRGRVEPLPTLGADAPREDAARARSTGRGPLVAT